jgi:eukaryotic-like serine/threonine-protein kinase
MPQESWPRINELFHAAIDLGREKRDQYLASACGNDQELRREVEDLIAAHEATESSMHTDFLRAAIREVAGNEISTLGQQFGPYQVVREIGRGGMGRVFLAERVDQEFRRRVAIKLIKRGMDTDAIVRHFRNEREILASLDHPNIARLFDGGTSDSGLPYFVMEYIDGRPINSYCDEHNYSIRERLQLFRKVCAAVAYAHQHLVIHRDIKPSNILVTPDGEPKLLDFGIARLLRTPEVSQISTTVTSLPLMTPEYASPEQILGFPTSTLTDVYSLGMVLYRLLVGTTPYAFCSLEQRSEKMRRGEPEKPSIALAEFRSEGIVTPPGSLTTVRSDPKKLQGDLDNIVLKAIRRESDRRYQSVEQLSDDVRRHLESLPVLARNDGVGYRLSKFARRHRTTVAAGGFALFLLIIGIVTTSLEARRARIQEQLAKQAEARAERRFNEIRNLARTVLFDYHDAIKNLPGSTPVRERLVRDALQYLDGLAAEAASDRSLLRELASAYERVADVQGGTLESNLGNTVEAIKSGQKALSIRQRLLASDPHDIEVQKELASSYIDVGTLLWETGDLVGAEDHFKKSVQLREQIENSKPHDPGVLRDFAAANDRLGMLLLERGDATTALAYHRKSLAIYIALPPPESLNEPTRRAFSVEYEHIGSDLLELNDLSGALQNNTRALQLRAELAKDFPLNTEHQRNLQVSYYNQGEILARMGNTLEAMANYRQDVMIAEKLLGDDPTNDQYRGDLAYGLIRVGDMQFKIRKFPGALANYKRSRELRASDVRTDPSNLWKVSSFIESKAKVCKALAAMYRYDEGREACSDVLSLMQTTKVAPENAAIRSFFADTFSDLAEAATISASDPSLPMSERHKLWQSARELYTQSREIWQDLNKRNILGPADKDKDNIASANIKRCEAALP